MPRTYLVLAAALASGIVAGVLFAFSNFIMAALARLTPSNGMAAMQAINITVISPLFMATLFGCAALALYLGFDAWRHWNEAISPLLLFATACYVLGVIGVTMFFNVPLNDGLASLDPAATSSNNQWTDYLSRWTWWNHIRCLASLVTSGAYIWALRLM